MKLYYETGACSLAARIVATEAGIPLEDEKVDLREKRTASGRDFREINVKGVVPALVLDDGEVLTEGPAIMQYLADLKPDSGMAPANGTMGRYRLQEMLGFINSEIHKTYIPLFYEPTPEVRSDRISILNRQYGIVDALLKQQPWLLGEDYTAADAYLFTVTNWAARLDIDLSAYEALCAFQERVAARPNVQVALRDDGL